MNYHPAVLSEVSDPRMSKRYVHVNTMDVIKVMEDQGFEVVDQKVDRVRKFNPEFARHMVVLRNTNLGTSDGTFIPQALFTNSHNGRSTADLRLGMYRFVCANGLVVGDDYARESIKHVGDLAKQVIDRIREMSKQSQKVFSEIDNWKAIDLSKERRLEFAKQAGILRFGEAKMQQYDVMDLLMPRRAEDDAGDLWSTYNIVQENASKGGLQGKNANGRRVRSKSLNSIGQDLDFNSKLWKLATEFAE